MGPLSRDTNGCGYGSRRPPGRLASGSPLAERAHQLVAQRLDQVGQHGAVAGLHEGFDLHAGYQLDIAETRDLFGRHRNTDRVIALPGALIGRNVGETRMTTPLNS